MAMMFGDTREEDEEPGYQKVATEAKVRELERRIAQLERTLSNHIGDRYPHPNYNPNPVYGLGDKIYK